MDKNLVIFFGDGESDNLDEKAIKLLKNSLGTEFLLLFRKNLDDDTKRKIITSPNVFAFVNPYWNINLPNIDGHSLKNILNELSKLANNVPNTTIFIIPYTLVLEDLASREYDCFYKQMDESFKNNDCPMNLLVAKREDSFYGKLTSQYQWLALGQDIKKITQEQDLFDDMYLEFKQFHINHNAKMF